MIGSTLKFDQMNAGCGLLTHNLDQFGWIAFLKYYPKGSNLGL
jgi:hypothetical protein